MAPPLWHSSTELPFQPQQLLNGTVFAATLRQGAKITSSFSRNQWTLGHKTYSIHPKLKKIVSSLALPYWESGMRSSAAILPEDVYIVVGISLWPLCSHLQCYIATSFCYILRPLHGDTGSAHAFSHTSSELRKSARWSKLARGHFHFGKWNQVWLPDNSHH